MVLVWHLQLLKLLPFFRLPRAKVVLFMHGTEVWPRQDWLTRRLLRRVDLFLSNSDYTWRRFAAANREFARAPHRLVHLGIGAPLPGPVPALASPPRALMVGRLTKSQDYKGHREVIGAWPGVLRRVPGAELWIAGEGDLRGDLERLAAARGVGGRVRFFGPVTEARKEALLAGSRCLALPSRGEGFGLVYLEAMRLGRPCLVGTADAGREVVAPPGAGLAADPGQPGALAGALGRLLTPGAEWAAWSAAARARYDRYFTARHFQERLTAAILPLWQGDRRAVGPAAAPVH
jgi:phosphatidylinositol alpha-1,6-mannosyltransferase